MKDVKYSYITHHETLDTRVVKVVYENGVGFILNYNTHPVEVDGTTVEAMSFIRLNRSTMARNPRFRPRNKEGVY